MKDDESSTTVGELLDSLKLYPRTTKVRIQGGLTFYRIKQRADELIQIEFNEPIHDIMRPYRESK